MLSGTFSPSGDRLVKSHKPDRERMAHTIGIVKTFARFCDGDERENVDECIKTLSAILAEIQPLSKVKP